MGRIVGIDLGTTNSVIGITDGNKTRILENRESRSHTRSVVSLKQSRSADQRPEEILVGDAAMDHWPLAPADTIISIKRLMGRGVADEQVQKVKAWAQYPIVTPEKGTDDSVRVVMGGKPYSPVEISAMILAKLREDAEFRLGEPVTHAVITVPAYFSQIQRDATRKAGMQAGLRVIRLLDEPTAVAIAFGMDTPESDETRYFLVYDLGGGTFDVSILVWSGQVFAPLNLEGDMWLGGDNFDQLIMEKALDRIKKELSLDPRQNLRFMAALRREAQVLKERLTASASAELVVPGLLRTAAGEIVDFSMEMTRGEFERLIHPLVDRTMSIVRTALVNADLLPEQIDNVLMAGNATAIPLVQRSMEQLFGQHKISRLVHPKHSVAMGAAILAHRLGPRIHCACGHTNAPEAAVCAACGRELVVGAPSGSAQPFVHGGIAPFHYGIQSFGDRFTPFIQKSDPYPTEVPSSHAFFTHTDNQRMFCLPVYCGDNLEKASRNEKAGEAFGILPSGLPKETPIRIKLWLDGDGVFGLSAHLEDGTNLKPWIMKGETDARAFKAIELSDEVIASKKNRNSLTPSQLRELDDIRNDALDRIRDGDFGGALSKAEQLMALAKAQGQSSSDLKSRATMLVNYALWILHRYSWAFRPDRSDFFRKLAAEVTALASGTDEQQLRVKVDELDRETDLLPEGVPELNETRYRIESRIKPVDPRTASHLADGLARAEDAYIKKDPKAATILQEVRAKVEAALRALPSNKFPCRCGAMLSGERFCPRCGGDNWLVDGPKLSGRTGDIPGAL
ncbi:MAG: Hsp70 family protein [Candidatus Riflebacteria bacterium]|nr:Hsp70 family protein [Candidatus Riflebacteria bacterium]